MPNEINTNDRFTAASHFFAEVNNISQSTGQTFGPVSQDVFRLTAKFTAQAGTKAFAICPGIVAIQPQTGSTSKINLILRPYQQPIKGINIRYFIYRGLNRSDFIDSTGKIIPIAPGVSDFIQKINTDFNDFHADEPLLPDFDAAFIGYRETIADLSNPFDNLFFSITQYEEQNGEQVEVAETAFELPKIDQGKSLGTFATGECGIDVILQYGDYLLDEADRFVFDYNYARASEAVIDLSSVTNEASRKRRKEQLFQFIDIAAFYGFHCLPNGTVTTAGNVEHDQATIYSQVLTPFATKNTYYLYIQSDRERSYDFYGNYRIDPLAAENMLYGTSENTLAARVYGTNGWPLILETTAQDHSEVRNKIYLQLVTDNNPNVVLYGQTACVDNALRNHFSTVEELKQPVDEENEQPKTTSTIILSNPAADDGGAKKHIANFGILIYQGASYSYIAGTETNEENETVNVYAQPNFFDDVFGNLGAVPLLKGYSETSVYKLPLGKIGLITHSASGKKLGISAIQTTVVRDVIQDESIGIQYRTIFFTQQIDFYSPTNQVKNSFYTDGKTTPSTVGSTSPSSKYSPEPPLNFIYSLIEDLDLNQTITSVKLVSSDKSLPLGLFLGLSPEEIDVIKISLDQNNLVNAKTYLSKIQSELQQTFSKFQLFVVGENEEGGLLALTINNIGTIYSLDEHVFFTKKFSDNMSSNLTNDYEMTQPYFKTL